MSQPETPGTDTTPQVCNTGVGVVPPPENLSNFWEFAKGICLKPRATIRQILSVSPGYMQKHLVIALTLLGGLNAVTSGIAAGGVRADVVILELLLSFNLTLLSIYPTAYLLHITGKPLGGKATFMELSTAVAWSMIPTLLTGLIGCFLNIIAPANPFLAPLVFLVGMIWGLKLIIWTGAEAQQFSIAKSILNQLFAAAIIIVPTMITLVMICLISPDIPRVFLQMMKAS